MSKSKSKRSSTHHALKNTGWDVKRDTMRAGRRLYGAGAGPKSKRN